MTLSVLVSGGLVAAFYVLPAGARDVWARTRAVKPPVQDTVSLLRAELHARLNLTVAESTLDAVRRQRLEAESTTVLAPRMSPRADSLRRMIGMLDALVVRAADAPLPESYRAIAESPAMRGDPRVRALLDSLSDIERERDEFGAGAAVDPVFVALTTRANALGRAIVAAASETRASLIRAQATAVGPRPAPPVNPVTLPDTMPAAIARDSARVALTASAEAIETARRLNDAATSAARQARTAVQLAPLPVLIAGSAVLALVLVFGLSLAVEVRAPRVADLGEVERAADAHALSVGARAIPPTRMRRAADRARPRLLDPQLDAYRMLAWHATSQSPRDNMIVVTGDGPVISATVAANLAAVLANEARSVLLLDIDFRHNCVANILSIGRDVPGIAEVLENRRRWPETVISVTTGRGRAVDCIPSGVRSRSIGPAESEALGAEIHRATRRYDTTIVNAPPSFVTKILRGQDAVICATRARSRLSWLARLATQVREEGARVLAVSLWEGVGPVDASTGTSAGSGALVKSPRASHVA